MIKMQVFLREGQKAALKKMAAQTGKRESDLVRQSVDLMLEKIHQDNENWKKATRAAAGIWKDRDMSWFDEMRARTRKRFAHVYGEE